MNKYRILFLAVLPFAASASAQNRLVLLPEDDPLTPESYQFAWATEPGVRYQVQQSTNLVNWRVVDGFSAGATSLVQRMPFAADAHAVFFRIRKLNDMTVPGTDLEMVWIEPGTFTMGSPSNERDRDSDEAPKTQVTISQGFWIGKYEVTVDQIRAYLFDGGKKNGIDFSDLDCPIENNSDFALSGNRFGQSGNQPMVEISWIGAQGFCEWLTQKERVAGRLPEGYVYRLPTEAQWEYACRAGTTTRFSYGDDPGYGQLDDHAWYSNNSNLTTHSVGQKLPNPWGLHDMHGNVWEWCFDWYLSSYPGGNVTDPLGRSSGSYRVRRGGSWGDDAGDCRSAYRGIAPDDAYYFLGFRVALAPSQPSRQRGRRNGR